MYMTKTPQFIEGVESFQNGQQGTLGRYPFHFHLCGSMAGNGMVFKNNAIRNSRQRCLSIHSTNDAVIEGNVAYNTSGHCFFIEDGGEHGNTFLNNLGMVTNPGEGASIVVGIDSLSVFALVCCRH